VSEPVDYWAKAHTVAAEHLEQCHLFCTEESEDDPSCAPFCGCTTCEVREVLYAAYDYLEKHFAEQKEQA